MSEQTDLIRTGNRFLKRMAHGDKPKHITADEGLSHWAFWKAVNAARAAETPKVISFHEMRYGRPPPANPDAAFTLSAADLRMLHAIRDEIKAADRRAIEMEIDREKLRQ